MTPTSQWQDIDRQELLFESCGGLSYRQIGERHDISHEQARQLVAQALDDLAFQCGLVLVRERANEQAGGPVVPPWIVSVPLGPDYVMGQELCRRLQNKLRERGVPFVTEVEHVPPDKVDMFGRPCIGGTVFRFRLDPEHDLADAAEES